MALQVWLPLDGNLENQGLSDVTVTNSGATVDNNGKIGKCYYFGGQNQITFPSQSWMSMKPANHFSVFCWVKGTTTGWLFAEGGWELLLRPTFARIGLSDNGQYPAKYSYSFDTNTWYHLGFTWSGSTGKLKLYLNGNLVASSDVPSSANFDINNSFKMCHSSGVYINDFRIYDHALSLREVKELAKGLILHYRLSKPMPNLLTGTDFNGSPQKFTLTSGSEGGFRYTPSETIIANTQYTLSCYIRGNANMNLYKICTGGNESVTWINRNELSATEYKKFSLTFNSPNSSKTMNQIYICTRYGTSNSQVGDWFEILPYSLKLEKNDYVTSWIPNTSDTAYSAFGYNSNIELDCAPAGNQNDGTIVGTITAAADSPRYETSYYFDGIDSAIQVPYNATVFQTNFTINLWFKKTELGSKNYETLFGGPGGFEMDTRANSSTTLSLFMASTRGGNVFSPFNFNEWYMVTLVNDGTNELYYINSELKKTIEKKSMPTGNYFIGAWSTSNKQNFKGYISDFRVYCTALSQEDIAELYHTAAQIDKDGNVYAYEFKEA